MAFSNCQIFGATGIYTLLLYHTVKKRKAYLPRTCLKRNRRRFLTDWNGLKKQALYAIDTKRKERYTLINKIFDKQRN